MSANDTGHETPQEARSATDKAEGDGPEPASGTFFSWIAETFGNSGDASANDDAGAANRGGNLLPGIVNLSRMRVEDVAIPAAEIVSVPLDIDRDALVGTFRDSGMTRLPVYEGTLDHPKGMIHLKDFALRHGFGNGDAPFDMGAMVRPLIYAPPSMPIGVLLQKMQSDRMHMALVIDEYGGVDGLVTIEDLIEQVIGQIEDEHDEEEADLWTREAPDCFVVQARAPLDEFQQEAGVNLREGLEDEEIDSLGGLVFVLAGRVPARGEVIPHPAGPEIEIVDADPRRLKRLRVRLAG